MRVVRSDVWPSASLISETGAPAFRAAVAQPWRAVWKVIGYAKKSRQKKIKRKPFEMSIVSVFCQIEKMQMTT